MFNHLVLKIFICVEILLCNEKNNSSTSFMQIMKFYKISFPLNKLQNMHIIKQEEWKEAGLMLYTKNS